MTVNLSKSGPSVSVGPRGSKVTVGRKGIRQTLGLTGTGLFATKYTPWSKGDEVADTDARRGATEPGDEAAPAELSAESEGMPPARSADETRCGFCGVKATRGQRCPMCNQPV